MNAIISPVNSALRQVYWMLGLFTAAVLFAFRGSALADIAWVLGVLALLWLILLILHSSDLRRQRQASVRLSERRGVWKSRLSQAGCTQSNSDQSLGFLRVMGEIDRAILSNASFDHIVELVLIHVPVAVPCLFVAVTLFGKSLPEDANTVVASQDGMRARYQIAFDEQLRQALDQSPGGYLIDGGVNYPVTSPAFMLDARCFLLFPIYRDGTLAAVLHFGLFKDGLLSENEFALARNFADRLGVSMTAIVRAKDLYDQEHFDPITSLPNRQFCIERLYQEISRACRHQQRLAILFVNLEGFKKVNDSAGYAGGDTVLQSVGQRLRSSLREPDVLARFGNDEFVILLPETTGTTEVGRVAEKLIALFADHFSYQEQVFYLNVDIGISLYPEDGHSGDVLLQRANTAMMRLKGREQGQYMFYEEQMNLKAMERLSMERDLRVALQQNQLFMVYQPQIDLCDGQVSGAEALVRWNHPELGLIPPIEFVGLAEETHLICQLGEYVRRAVCSQYHAWILANVTPPRIALNVSSSELRRSNFANEVLAVLDEFEVPVHAIEIEITESLFIDESGSMVETLRTLSGMGFKIAVDDFGTGYSCLSYLAWLPFDVLKVDRSFVSQIGLHAGGGAIVAMIIDIAHHLGKTVVAEGAEDEIQRSFLLDHGCEVLQGYIVSRPLAADDFVAFLRQRESR